MKQDKKQKNKIENRHPVLGIMLLLLVLVCAGILIFDKYNEKVNIFDNLKETIPEWISNVLGSEESNPEVSNLPVVQNTNIKTPSQQSSPQTTPQQTTPLAQTEPCPGPNLTPEEIEKIRQGILGSDFVKDLPKNGVISLTFFTFCNGERIIQNNFLIGKNQILSSGTPDIYLTLHSKYIFQFSGNNLCEIIKSANANGDLGMYSDEGNTKLMLKYSGLLKYKDCFGF